MKTLSLNYPTLAWIRRLLPALILAAGFHGLAPVALAGPIASSEMLTDSTRTTDLATIQQALEHKVVQQRLGELGFTGAEIQQRLDHATDAELHQLATESEAMMAGGITGLVISVLVIILLVFLIMRVK